MKKILVSVVALIFLYAKAKSQDAINNTGNLQIHSGASVGVFGNFANTASATMLNNGSLYLKKNIVANQPSMNAGTGTLYFNGSSTQTVTGSQVLKTYNLVTSNAAGITLNNNLSIDGSHTFSAGIITTASSNYLIYSAGSTYSGTGDSKHVNGWVKKLGATNFVFPIGNGSAERTIAITGLSASSEFNARYYTNTPNTTQLISPLVTMNPTEYWGLNRTAGGTASVMLNWNTSKQPFPNWTLPEIRATVYNGTYWIDAGGTATGNPATTGAITSNILGTFNLFSFASVSYVLPVKLVTFKAVRTNSITAIRWTTANEKNAHHFTVERSDDGSTFYSIAQLPARNRANEESYFTEDRNVIGNVAYYRLRIVDNNTKESFSSVVKVLEEKTGSYVKLLTNPVKSTVVLSTVEALGQYQYSIHSSSGQLLQSGSITLDNNKLAQLPLRQTTKPGVYILSLANGVQRFEITFMAE